MSEICRNCPIESNDPDLVILNAAAAEMVVTGRPTGNGWIQEAYNMFDSYSRQDIETAELLFEAQHFPAEKINQARRCAEFILLKECEFNNLI